MQLMSLAINLILYQQSKNQAINQLKRWPWLSVEANEGVCTTYSDQRLTPAPPRSPEYLCGLLGSHTVQMVPQTPPLRVRLFVMSPHLSQSPAPVCVLKIQQPSPAGPVQLGSLTSSILGVRVGRRSAEEGESRER